MVQGESPGYSAASLAAELGLDVTSLDAAAWAAPFGGNALPESAEPLAQACAGHQFGGFSPQLGNGCALLVSEVIDRQGRRRDIAFKGSGRAPFRRNRDGKAAVGPMLREVLVGEAMHALGIPTTRALAVVATGGPVYREDVLPGAVPTRVASCHFHIPGADPSVCARHRSVPCSRSSHRPAGCRISGSKCFQNSSETSHDSTRAFRILPSPRARPCARESRTRPHLRLSC